MWVRVWWYLHISANLLFVSLLIRTRVGGVPNGGGVPTPDPPTSDEELTRRRAYRLAFGDVIRDARRAAGITQEQVADRAETSRPTIARIEGGTHSTTLDRLWAIADAVGVPAAELVERTAARAGRYDHQP